MTDTFHPLNVLGKLDYLVDLNKSIKRPEGDTSVIGTEHGWMFPEDVQLYNHNDEWLYAFGANHVWRSADPDLGWELVK
jgi:hypothetical protein